MYFASSSLTHLSLGMEKPILYRVSFKIVNPAARFLTFLASSMPTRRRLSCRKERIRFIQLVWFWITKVWSSSILGCLCTSTFKSVEPVPSSDDACLATLSASKFYLQRICVKSTWLNSWTSCFINLRYFCILLSLLRILLLSTLSPT